MSTLAAIIRDLASIESEIESTPPAAEGMQCADSSEQDEAGQAADAIMECGAVVLRSFQEITQEWLGAWQQVLASQAALLSELPDNGQASRSDSIRA
jgi:hypothetical protein